MKKILFVLLFVCIAVFPAFSENEKKEMVYADVSMQEKLYEMLQQETDYNYYKSFEYKHLHVVKESITKVYTIPLLEYAENKEMTIVPVVREGSFGISEEEKEEGNVYVAKVVCDDGSYAGVFTFSLENGEIHGSSYTMSFAPALEEFYPDRISSWCAASCSYADHADRIRDLLGYEEYVSVYDVRYISITPHSGIFFCISTSDGYILIPVGLLSKNETSDFTMDKINRKIFTEADVAVWAEKYKVWWEEQQKHEPFGVTGGGTFECEGFNGTMVSSADVKNVINVYEYLGITPEDTKKPEVLGITAGDAYEAEEKGIPKITLIFGITGLLIVFAGGMGIYFRKKRVIDKS